MSALQPRSIRPGILAVVATAFLVACDARPIVEGRAANQCTMCHGGLADESGAPPHDVNFAADSAAVGAHSAHVRAGVACESCHVVPDGIDSANHIDGDRAEVTFGGLAVAGTTSPPEYNRQTLTCSGVYCHGATLAGGADTAPSWTQTLGACGSCHGAPPPSHGVFVNPTNCSGCHGAAVETDNVTFKPAHLSGSLDFNE